MSVERHINHTYFVRSIMLNANVVLRNVSAVFGNEFYTIIRTISMLSFVRYNTENYGI